MIDGLRYIKWGDQLINVPLEKIFYQLAEFDSIRVELPSCELHSRESLEHRCIVDATNFSKIIEKGEIGKVDSLKMAPLLSYLKQQSNIGKSLRITAFALQKEYRPSHRILSTRVYPKLQASFLQNYLIDHDINTEWQIIEYVIEESPPSFVGEIILVIEPQ